MKTLLKEENCFIRQNVSDWKEAIHVACEPLIAQNYCTEEYEKAVFESTEQFGPYYVLCENLALIHASSRSGVNDTQMAITVLKEPTRFTPDGWDVRVLVTLVAKDSHSHIKGIQAVSCIFEDQNKVNRILNVTEPKEIFDLFMESAEEFEKSNI